MEKSMDEDDKQKSVPSPSRKGIEVTKAKIDYACQMLKKVLRRGIDKRSLLGTQICIAGILAGLGNINFSYPKVRCG